MLDIEVWMNELVSRIKEEFGERVEFVGLQGSYARNEAHEESDIDVVVILDSLSIQDLKRYRELVAEMPEREKACGFISGADEIAHWEPAELFQFYHDTKPVWGNMDHLMCLVEREDIKRAIRIGACNLYHACCHNFIYEQSPEMLLSLYKPTFFILQAKHYDETGCYLRSKETLKEQLKDTDKEILSICLDRPKSDTLSEADFHAYHEKLLAWCSALINQYKSTHVCYFEE